MGALARPRRQRRSYSSATGPPLSCWPRRVTRYGSPSSAASTTTRNLLLVSCRGHSAITLSRQNYGSDHTKGDPIYPIEQPAIQPSETLVREQNGVSPVIRGEFCCQKLTRHFGFGSLAGEKIRSGLDRFRSKDRSDERHEKTRVGETAIWTLSPVMARGVPHPLP